jgi:hypothetical protein
MGRPRTPSADRPSDEPPDPARREGDRRTAAGNRGAALVEGEDYYSEGGLLVFTALYHLKRGYCCNSGCRHCPYEKSPGARDA